MRSRNQRSWLIIIAQPVNSRASSSDRSVHAKIVGRLVKQQKVCAGFEHLRQ